MPVPLRRTDLDCPLDRVVNHSLSADGCILDHRSVGVLDEKLSGGSWVKHSM